jgi:hypothetical protein
MPIPAYRAKQSANTTGTGTLVLNAAEENARSFNAAFGASSRRILYMIQFATGYEFGLGDFDGGSPGSLTRATVLASSNANALVTLPGGTKDVFAVFDPAAREVLNISSTTTLALADLGNAVVFTGASAATLSLPAVTTAPLGAGWMVNNSGTAALTIDPSGSELVSGAATLVLQPGQSSILTRVLGAWNAAISGYIPSPSEMRNLIINGNPVINQRVYVSGTATSGANQYTLDRWRVVVSGQALSWTDSAGIRTVTFPAGGAEQVIEGLNNLGGVHTLSWVGNATATVNGASVANGGQVTLTGNTDVTIRMSGGTGALMQLERGAIATPFGFRQHGQELALCYRYLSIQDAYARGTASGAGAVIETPIYWPVTMRVTPTLTGPVGALNLNVSSAITAAPTVRSCRFSITAAAAGDFYSLGGLVAASSEF